MEIPPKPKREEPRPTKKGAERSQQDQIWKEILDTSLEICMSFFFPSYHKRIDWKKGYEILDKEMMDITEEGRLGRQSADKLFKVKMRSGEDELWLLHFEVQGYTDNQFAERVRLYNRLIWLKYRETVRSFAVLTDPSPSFRVNKVEVKDAGFRDLFQFPMVKLLDYEQEKKWARLQRSKNPFALVVMAHLQAMRLKNRPIELKEAKIQLVRMLFERGYSRDYVIKLLQFIKWLVTLPPDLETQFRAELREMTSEEQMKIVSSYDLVVLEEGRQEGRQEGFLEVLEDLLRDKFGLIEEPLIARLRTLSPDQLKKLAVFAAKVTSLDDFKQRLDQQGV